MTRNQQRQDTHRACFLCLSITRATLLRRMSGRERTRTTNLINLGPFASYLDQSLSQDLGPPSRQAYRLINTQGQVFCPSPPSPLRLELPAITFSLLYSSTVQQCPCHHVQPNTVSLPSCSSQVRCHHSSSPAMAVYFVVMVATTRTFPSNNKHTHEGYKAGLPNPLPNPPSRNNPSHLIFSISLFPLPHVPMPRYRIRAAEKYLESKPIRAHDHRGSRILRHTHKWSQAFN
jgi:hypothetical protein